MNKIEALAKVLECEVDEIETERVKNAWYEVDMYVDYLNQYYLILTDEEYYYNSDMYEVENMHEISRAEYWIFEVI